MNQCTCSTPPSEGKKRKKTIQHWTNSITLTYIQMKMYAIPRIDIEDRNFYPQTSFKIKKQIKIIDSIGSDTFVEYSLKMLTFRAFEISQTT